MKSKAIIILIDESKSFTQRDTIYYIKSLATSSGKIFYGIYAKSLISIFYNLSSFLLPSTPMLSFKL